MQLTGRQVHHADVGRAPLTLEQLLEVRLHLTAGERVEEPDHEGWAATADPEHRVLEGGAPRRAEERGPILTSQRLTLIAVVLVALHALLNYQTELHFGCTLRGGDAEDVGEVGFLALNPVLKARDEAPLHGSQH